MRRGAVACAVVLLLAVLPAAAKPQKLAKAASQGDAALVAKLLKKGTHPATAALTAAAGRGHAEVVRLLLDAGADVNGRDRWGNAVLHRVLGDGGDPALFDLLLEAGADPARVNGAEEAPLHIATRHGRSDLVERLLAAGVEVNPTDRYGRTPLDYAVEHEHAAIEASLRAAGAAAGERIAIDAAGCPDKWGELWVGMSHEQFTEATGMRTGIGGMSTGMLADDATVTMNVFGKTVRFDKQKRIVSVDCP